MQESHTQAPARRIPLLLDIEFRRSYARRGEKGKLKNISLTGAFLQVDASLAAVPKDKIMVTIFVGGRKRQIHAHVVWSCDMGCGIKFTPANNRDVQIVDDLMYFVENSRTTQRSVLDTIFKKVS